MAAPSDFTLTWDLAPAAGGPQRPSVNTMGEAALEDDAENAPVAPIMPTAAMLNQWQKQLAAQGAVVAALKVSVRFSGGVPALYKFTCPTGNLSFGDITITDGGVGITTVSWPADILPPPVTDPLAGINSTVSGMVCASYASATSVLVKTFDGTNAAADRDFTLYID